MFLNVRMSSKLNVKQSGILEKKRKLGKQKSWPLTEYFTESKLPEYKKRAAEY